MVASTTSDSTFDFTTYADLRRLLVEQRLSQYLDCEDPAILWQSMRYSLLSGGKRLRALLCLASAEAIKGETGIELALPCACAIELVHAMSLIHDDLPCLDNDDLRRGKPTNHKVFGEAMALLAGDALLAYANEILIAHTRELVDPSVLLSVAQELSKATGAQGMVGGQVDDMEFTGLDGKRIPLKAGTAGAHIDASIVEKIHRRKTGALIRFSVWSGARLCGASDYHLKELARYGEILGLAFQIADDLLDVTGDISTLGKTPGKDEATGKATWVRVFGEEGSRARLKELETEGLEILERLPLTSNGLDSTAPLKALLTYSINRTN